MNVCFHRKPPGGFWDRAPTPLMTGSGWKAGNAQVWLIGSVSRILRFDSEGITFRYKDYRRNGAERQQAMTLGANEFIRRFLLHSLPRGFHRIRHYGLLASATRKAHLEHARRLLAVAPPVIDDTAVDPLDPRPPCPCCVGSMVIIETFERRYQPRAPPHPVNASGRTSP